jgi:DNA-binding MarR family transcriptional regulator
MVDMLTEDPAYRLFALLKEISTCCQDREVLQAKTHGLTQAEARSLVTLKLFDIRTTAELSERLLVAKSRVTRILDGLVKKGLIRRIEDTEDRRKCLVKLTPKGERLMNRLFKDILGVHQELMDALPPERKEAFFLCLQSLVDTMEVVKKRLDEKIPKK